MIHLSEKFAAAAAAKKIDKQLKLWSSTTRGELSVLGDSVICVFLKLKRCCFFLKKTSLCHKTKETFWKCIYRSEGLWTHW